MVRVVLAAVVLCALALCTDANADVVNRYCSAQWTLVATYRNPSKKAIQQSFNYHAGTQQSHRISRETLKSILVTTQTGTDHQKTKFRTTNSDMGSVKVRPGSVRVPAKSAVNVWQIVARTGGEVVNFQKTLTLKVKKSPPPIASCQANYRLRQRITDQTWVQLKHKITGMYLTTTNRKGWDAGTLSRHKNNRFRFEQVRPGVYRIIAKSVRFPGYRYLYSSFAGGIYFDDSDTSNGKQLWTLSTNDLRDGDSITIQNVYYPGAYMIRYEGSTTNVYCEYTSYPDRWIVELA